MSDELDFDLRKALEERFNHHYVCMRFAENKLKNGGYLSKNNLENNTKEEMLELFFNNYAEDLTNLEKRTDYIAEKLRIDSGSLFSRVTMNDELSSKLLSVDNERWNEIISEAKRFKDIFPALNISYQDSGLKKIVDDIESYDDFKLD